MTITKVRILPPFAIGRQGSSEKPLDNFTIEDGPDPLGFRRIKPAPTLIVCPDSGEIRDDATPSKIEFKDDQGKIRPVAPFLQVFAETDADSECKKNELEPLTYELLERHGFKNPTISWRVIVANRKVMRRTGKKADKVIAQTDKFSDHDLHRLAGRCDNFLPDRFIDFGHARFIKPNSAFPAIRLRFAPAKGLIYGANIDKTDPVIEGRAIYDTAKAGEGQGLGWKGFQVNPDIGDAQSLLRTETMPPSLFAISSPAPPWFNHNVAISRGYFDDACDGFVQVFVRDGVEGVEEKEFEQELQATARICAAPPALVPDTLFIRNLADDFEQIIYGPEISGEEPDVTRWRAQDIVRRAYETVRFMNVAVMNGADFKGFRALLLDSMPQEEAADTQRPIRPVMPAGTVDTLSILALHQQALAALRAGAAPWFLRQLRRPDEVADFTDRGRRKMPALMCGADNNYLALTWRQIDAIRKAVEGPKEDSVKTTPPAQGSLTPRNGTAKAFLAAQIFYAVAGNPISSRPVSAVANCCPGLEVDFRAVWRRMFKGIELREYDNLVVTMTKDQPQGLPDLSGRRLLRIYPTGDPVGIATMAPIIGPASSDVQGAIGLTSNRNPYGQAPLEWSNALATVLASSQGQVIRCDFSKDPSSDTQLPWIDGPKDEDRNYESHQLEVRLFFEPDTAVISKVLADAGELTQGLCSPWQNDYRECSCYYWASARPDYVNVEHGPDGESIGDNWLQKKRTKDYVPDDYADSRLILYDQLFREWEHYLKFQIGGRDSS